ncbi:MAG: phospholipid carrier-dependent glycosyltransferase [Chloroflexi bacterium]|nr:phospholipid carrier-dependent glycosyltransferase [Chloroflexota bacterium]
MKTLFAHQANRKLTLLLIAFVALAAFYSIIIPLFEGPDEDDHFRFAKYIADQRALPVQQFVSGGGDAGHQGWQPPLYYALAALVITPIDTSDYSEHLYRNYAATFIGDPSCCGRNIYYHFANENFPYTRTTLAVHLARLLSVLFGAITVTATYALAKSAVETAPTQTPSQPPSAHPTADQPTQVGFVMLLPRLESPHLLPLAAASIVAFNPSFLFASALVSNDTLLAAFASLVLLMWVKLAQGQIALNAKSAALLGALLGLAVLTKTTALGLVPLTLLLFALLAWRQRNLPSWIFASFALFAPIVLLTAWWFVRNYFLYGDPLAARLVEISALFPRTGPLTLAELFQINLPWLWQTFWGGPTPGDFPPLLLGGLGILTFLAILGLFKLLTTNYDPSAEFALSEVEGFRTESRNTNYDLRFTIFLPAAWVFLILIAQLQFIRLTVGADQGRYLFPAIAAFAFFFALGLCSISDFGLRIAKWLSRILNLKIRNTQYELRILNYEFRILNLLFFALAAFVPLAYTIPAYTPPPLLSESDLARVASPLAINFANQLELRGAEISARAVKPGETLDVTLYWRARAPMRESYRVFVQLIGQNDRRAGGADVIPARGAFPTLYWKPGDALRDVVRVPIDADAAPGKYAVQVGLYPVAKPGERLNIVRTDESRAIVGSIKIGARATPAFAPATRLDANFGGNVELWGIDSTRRGDQLTLALYWRALKSIERDYVVFVHVLDESGRIVAQIDQLPQAGNYPTSIWDQGEVVRDEYALALPAAQAAYRIAIGLYRADTGERLPIIGAARDEFIFEITP